MRIGIAGLWHETNTYAARPADLAAFEEFELARGHAIVERHRGADTVIGGFLDGLAADGPRRATSATAIGGLADGVAAGGPRRATTATASGGPADGVAVVEPVPLAVAGAWPCGPAPASTIERLLGDLDAALAAAGPLDGVLLDLHGAMVAEGCEDPERAALQLVRDRVGDAPIVVVLDLHGNPSPEAIALCDAVVGYDTYPHVDMRERGAEAAALLRSAIGGRALRSVVAKVPLLSCPLAQATQAEPMAALLARARTLADGDRRLARISLLPGFPYSDVPRAGFSVVVTADAAAHARAAEVAMELAGEVLERRDAFAVMRPSPAEAVARALESEPPVVIADVADNVGGGAPGDGTVLLAELLRQGAAGAVVQIADAEVARQAVALGPGAKLDAYVGAKSDDRHGAPIAVSGRIERVSDGRFTSSSTWMRGRSFTLGATAVVAVDGVTLVITERAVPPFHADALLSLGIEPAAAAIIVAKGAIAWRAAFGSVARTVIEADTPGICPIDVTALERRTVPAGFDPGA
jgi:microcystin degradation protein MlrC